MSKQEIIEQSPDLWVPLDILIVISTYSLETWSSILSVKSFAKFSITEAGKRLAERTFSTIVSQFERDFGYFKIFSGFNFEEGIQSQEIRIRMFNPSSKEKGFASQNGTTCGIFGPAGSYKTTILREFVSSLKDKVEYFIIGDVFTSGLIKESILSSKSSKFEAILLKNIKFHQTKVNDNHLEEFLEKVKKDEEKDKKHCFIYEESVSFVDQDFSKYNSKSIRWILHCSRWSK